MIASAQELLTTFDQLPQAERIEIGVEILKRLATSDFPALTDQDLTLNAEELFLTLDQEEAE